MNVTRVSMFTGKEHTRFISGLTQEMLDAHKAGQMAQAAFKGIPAEEREFIMTGVTPEEWLKFLGPEPEE